jgi:hypothetical protein
MPNKIVMVVLVVLYCGFVSPLWAAQPDLATADWSVSSPHSLATNPPVDDAILAFLHKLTRDGEINDLGMCSSRFADLRHSGNLSLVASTSDGRFCYPLIVDKTPSGFELYVFDQPHTDIGEIQDLGGDGKQELIVSTEFTSYLGAMHCVAIWPVIYAWTGNGYTDVSNQYRGYYEKQLASMKEQIAAAGERNASAVSPMPALPASVRQISPVVVNSEHTSGPSAGFGVPAFVPAPEMSPSAASPAATSTPAYVSDCTEAEAAKIERFLGISKDAGMSDAIKWADSDNPYQREFAADVLRDIGTPDAVEYLRTLTHDSNRTVAGDAQISLSAVGRPVLHTIDRDEVQPLTGSPPK